MVTVVLTGMFHCSGKISAKTKFGIPHRYHWKVVAHQDDTNDSHVSVSSRYPLLWIRINHDKP